MISIDEVFIFGAKYLIFVLAALAFYWFLRMKRDDQVKMVRFATLALPLTYVMGVIAGLCYYNARPFVTGGFAPLIAHAQNNGFPSDHALAAFAVAALFVAFNRKRAFILFVLAGAVGFSRVLVGVHHYLDVDASLVFALLGWYISTRLLARFDKKVIVK